MATEPRLIDANDLWSDIMMLPHNGDIISSEEVEQAIKDAPTIEARPVVHGEWIAVPSSDMMTGKAYKCSECGKMRYGSWRPNYCAVCGAQMDGGTDNGMG